MIVGHALGGPDRADLVLARADDLHEPDFLRVGDGQRFAHVAPAVFLEQLAADADGLAGGLRPFEHQPRQRLAVDQPFSLTSSLRPSKVDSPMANCCSFIAA